MQLALVGSMATDDPEGWDFFQQTHEHAAGDEDIKILNNLNNVGAIEVNAFQSQADVVLQKSIREGFGLTVSEALWKARPDDRRATWAASRSRSRTATTGYLVNSPEEAAEACIEVLSDPELGKRLGPRRQGIRPHALPDAAPAARLAADLHRPGLRRVRRWHGAARSSCCPTGARRRSSATSAASWCRAAAAAGW